MHAWEFSQQRDAVILHVMLQAHCVMTEFHKVEYHEHPAFYPKLVMQLFVAYIPKLEKRDGTNAIKELQGQIRQAKKEQMALKRGQDSLISKYKVIEKHLREIEQKGGSKGGGGMGNGAGDATLGGRKRRPGKH